MLWSLDCRRDLQWWLRGDRFSRDVSHLQVSPVLPFWCDASGVGLGPRLGDRVVSGLWDQLEALLPVNVRELLAVRHGLLHFRSFLSGTTVAVFCGNVTTVPYLLKGRISFFVASVAGDVRPVCHFRPSPLLHLFSPYRDPLSAWTDALLQSWDGLLACAFPPWSVLPRVLAKLRVSHRTLLTLIAQYWPQRSWFVDLLQLSVAPPVPLSARPDLLFQPQSRRRYPSLHGLALYAWRLSSVSPGRLVSPRRWLRRLH